MHGLHREEVRGADAGHRHGRRHLRLPQRRVHGPRAGNAGGFHSLVQRLKADHRVHRVSHREPPDVLEGSLQLAHRALPDAVEDRRREAQPGAAPRGSDQELQSVLRRQSRAGAVSDVRVLAGRDADLRGEETVQPDRPASPRDEGLHEFVRAVQAAGHGGSGDLAAHAERSEEHESSPDVVPAGDSASHCGREVAVTTSSPRRSHGHREWTELVIRPSIFLADLPEGKRRDGAGWNRRGEVPIRVGRAEEEHQRADQRAGGVPREFVRRVPPAAGSARSLLPLQAFLPPGVHSIVLGDREGLHGVPQEEHSAAGHDVQAERKPQPAQCVQGAVERVARAVHSRFGILRTWAVQQDRAGVR